MAEEKAKFTKHTITNVSGGPKVINSPQGHILQAGQVAEDVELNEAELASAKATGYFEFGAAAAKRAAKDEGEE